MTNELKERLAILQQILDDISIPHEFAEATKKTLIRQFKLIHAEIETIETNILKRNL